MKEHFEISNARRKIILLVRMRWRSFKSKLTTHKAFAKGKVMTRLLVKSMVLRRTRGTNVAKDVETRPFWKISCGCCF